MKTKKLFSLSSLFALTLCACDIINTSESFDMSNKVFSYQVETTAVAKKDDTKTYVITSGTVSNYKDEFKWAWRVVNQENDIIYGEDLNFVNLPVDTENNTFTAELCLSDIDGLLDGTYSIYGGSYSEEIPNALEISTNKGFCDYKYQYSFTEGKLNVEPLNAPFVVSEASIVNRSGALFFKMGGYQASSYTIEELRSWNTQGDFQQMSPYAMLTIDDAFWSIESSKVFYYMNADGMELNKEYMVRHTLDSYSEMRIADKVVPVSDFLTNNVYTFADYGVEYEIYYDTNVLAINPIPNATNFFGGLGIRCRRPIEPFMIKEASIVKNPINRTGLYLKIGGKQAYEYTLQALNEWNTVPAFQQVSPYRIDSIEDFYWSIENSNVYLYVSVATMNAGYDYFTHLDLDAPTPLHEHSKCLPAVSFLEDNIYSFPDDHVRFEIHYQVRKSTVDIGEEDYYGALAIKCRVAN